MKPLQVAINAQIIPSKGAGGVENVVIGLVSALGKLEGQEKYIIITPWQDPYWIKPYIGPNQVIVPGQRTKMRLKTISKSLLGPALPMVRKILKSSKKSMEKETYSVPISNGFYENIGADLIHFPYQAFVHTSLPSIYNPHDLQHLHYPQFFTHSEIKWRETIYPSGCRKSNIVVVASQWIKQDIIDNYKINPEKIQVIPWAPLTHAFQYPSPEKLLDLKSKYQLDTSFAFYPAMTWEHKNHLRLLDALAYLRDKENIIVNLVCTGNKESSLFPKIEEKISKLNLRGQVKFLGIIPNSELRALYKLAEFVIVPTLFEAASGPVFEAWQEGVPVACSTVTSLPEQVGNAALLFDPNSIEAIAIALKRMSSDQKLRDDLKRKGTRRLQDFSWERTAKAYRAVYRLAAGRALSDEDMRLLSWDWMQNPDIDMEILS